MESTSTIASACCTDNSWVYSSVLLVHVIEASLNYTSTIPAVSCNDITFVYINIRLLQMVDATLDYTSTFAAVICTDNTWVYRSILLLQTLEATLYYTNTIAATSFAIYQYLNVQPCYPSIFCRGNARVYIYRCYCQLYWNWVNRSDPLLQAVEATLEFIATIAAAICTENSWVSWSVRLLHSLEATQEYTATFTAASCTKDGSVHYSNIQMDLMRQPWFT